MARIPLVIFIRSADLFTQSSSFLGRPELEVDLPEAPVLLSISLCYYYRLAAAAAVTRTHFSSRDQFGNLPVTVDTIRGLRKMHHSITDRLSSLQQCNAAFDDSPHHVATPKTMCSRSLSVNSRTRCAETIGVSAYPGSRRQAPSTTRSRSREIFSFDAAEFR